MKKRVLAFVLSAAMVLSFDMPIYAMENDLLLEESAEIGDSSEETLILSDENAFGDEDLIDDFGAVKVNEEALEEVFAEPISDDTTAGYSENIPAETNSFEAEESCDCEDVEELKKYQSGKDYAEGEVYAVVENIDVANSIANALGAKLVSYEYKVALYSLPDGLTVLEAVSMANSSEWDLPLVYANYIRQSAGSMTALENSGNALERDLASDNYNSSSKLCLDTDEAVSVEDSLNPNRSDIMEHKLYYIGDTYVRDEKSYYYQYHHDAVGSKYAWSTGYFGEGVDVAVFGSGIINHAEFLIGNGYDTVTSTSITNKADNTDKFGDGTAVASIIGARLNNSLGGGVAPDCTLHNVKITADSGDIYDSNIVMGINWSISNGIEIINIGSVGIQKSSAVEAAVNNAR